MEVEEEGEDGTEGEKESQKKEREQETIRKEAGQKQLYRGCQRAGGKAEDMERVWKSQGWGVSSVYGGAGTMKRRQRRERGEKKEDDKEDEKAKRESAGHE